MDKVREEFESWAKSEFDIDCSEMSFGGEGNDKREQYRDYDDQDGAIIVSAMFYAWKASRAALCVELPEREVAGKYADDFEDGHESGFNDALSDCKFAIKKSGVSYK